METCDALWTEEIVHTTQMHFLNWHSGERLFVHCNNEIYEITLGACEGIDREIREGFNIEHMLIAGAFDWCQLDCSDKTAKEMHVYLNNELEYAYDTVVDTNNALNSEDIVHTTQTHFLRWNYAERLFVHLDDKIHEIALGDCEGTNREIRKIHNIEKMLISGEFDWF
jgi:hypothetical protein